MSTVHFDHATGRLWLLNDKMQPIAGPWAAANFVDSQSRGPFPLGTFRFDAWQTHPGDGPESPLGTSGVILFKVPSREGMGVHGGRETSPDALGRKGIAHATFGCIRTSNEAMTALRDAHAAEAITELS